MLEPAQESNHWPQQDQIDDRGRDEWRWIEGQTLHYSRHTQQFRKRDDTRNGGKFDDLYGVAY